jgi:myo-inositol-1(or 4)-monophosphatase
MRPHPDELRAILDRAHGIAREAGALVLEGWRRAPAVRSKAKSDLVTEYDTRCERLLRDALGRSFPDHGVVGEEAEGPQQRDRALVWYVDPIDGTTNFAHGHPWFCISMGLVARAGEREEPIAGVVIAPGLGTVWSAGRGLGAHRESALGTERLSVSSTAALDDALLATGFPANRRTTEDNNYAHFLALDSTTHGVRRCAAAALEICLVADGAYDAFWDIGLKAWDLTAGAVIVAEAGGCVSNMDGSALDLHGARFLASNRALHGRMVEALAAVPSLPPGLA